RRHAADPVDLTSTTPADVSAGHCVRSPGFEAHDTIDCGAGVGGAGAGEACSCPCAWAAIDTTSDAQTTKIRRTRDSTGLERSTAGAARVRSRSSFQLV